MSTNPEDVNALEKCFRPFIIKCIQAIVQARSGNVYNTSCMSDVGARNNMMVYIEDDPEIGATIKQSLDSGFSVKPGDSFTVEIYGRVGNDLPLLEAWHFSIDSSETNNNGNANGSVSQGTNSNAQTVPGITDLRRTRFLERLGTLLKTLLVTTRMLPAYFNSRKPIITNEPLCFLVRRGPPPGLSALGPHCQGRSVGTIAVPTLTGVVLKLYVHYRSLEAIRILREKQTELLNASNQTVNNTTKNDKNEKITSKNESKKVESRKIKSRAAFVDKYVNYDVSDSDDGHDDGDDELVVKTKKFEINDNIDDEEDDDDCGEWNQRGDHISGGTSPQDDGLRTNRLQLPFSNHLYTSADYSRFFSDLKLKFTDCDLFTPQGCNSQTNSGGLDMSGLKDELLYHERMSVQFDHILQRLEQSQQFGAAPLHHFNNPIDS